MTYLTTKTIAENLVGRPDQAQVEDLTAAEARAGGQETEARMHAKVEGDHK